MQAASRLWIKPSTGGPWQGPKRAAGDMKKIIIAFDTNILFFILHMLRMLRTDNFCTYVCGNMFLQTCLQQLRRRQTLHYFYLSSINFLLVFYLSKEVKALMLCRLRRAKHSDDDWVNSKRCIGILSCSGNWNKGILHKLALHEIGECLAVICY